MTKWQNGKMNYYKVRFLEFTRPKSIISVQGWKNTRTIVIVTVGMVIITIKKASTYVNSYSDN